MDDPVALPSPQLLEANRRLYNLRAQAQAQRVGNLVSNRQVAGEALYLQADEYLPWEDLSAPVKDMAGVADVIEAVPAHLGWGSDAVTAVIRRHGQQETDCVEDDQDWLARLADLSRAELRETAVAKPTSTTNTTPATPNNPKSAIRNPKSDDWVKLYPDIGLGMLRQEMAAPGRLWLMLRYLDQQGSGQIRIDIMRQRLTPKSSTLRLCGKRQLRNLLRDGEGVFWTRDKEHVWLFSAARVAYALDVERLTGQPVGVPVSALLDGIGSFRAHLYAAFHSGRTKETLHGTQACPERSRRAMPIARDTLAGLSGVGESSQRAYETRAGVKVQANFAVGELAQEENRENRAWAQGQALFELKDYRGQQGKKGKTYLAWQLPNTYIGKHQKRPKGRQKRINRKLKDLVMKGMPGNVGGTSETQKPEKVYYPNGKLAAKAYGRDPERELYWRRHGTGNGRFEVWQQLGSG